MIVGSASSTIHEVMENTINTGYASITVAGKDRGFWPLPPRGRLHGNAVANRGNLADVSTISVRQPHATKMKNLVGAGRSGTGEAVVAFPAEAVVAVVDADADGIHGSVVVGSGIFAALLSVERQHSSGFRVDYPAGTEIPLGDEDEVETRAHQVWPPDILNHPEDVATGRVDHPQLIRRGMGEPGGSGLVFLNTPPPTGAAAARDRCVAAKAGSEMSARHPLDTHWSRHRVFTGSLASTSKMMSSGRETETPPSPSMLMSSGRETESPASPPMMLSSAPACARKRRNTHCYKT
jgi:hypothetical protein